jgi:hypothetical protein
VKLRLYMDEDGLDHALAVALRARGVDVLTALEAGMIERDDDLRLDYATAEGRVLYSYNISDYCRIHARYMQVSKEHAGIILAQQRQFSIGEQMRRLLNLIAARPPEEMRHRLKFLSAWG